MSEIQETENHEEFSCGLGRWRPKYLRKFATIKYFMIVYGLLGTIQAMSFVYFIATLTTLEKRFQIRSEITGILMSGNEMSQIFLSIILAYRGGKGNRPVWIAWGVLFSSLSCFILALPHFIYGPGSNAIALTTEFLDYQVLNSSSNSTNDFQSVLCFPNRTDSEIKCDKENAEKPWLSLSLIFFSQFVLGVGTTLYVTLGQPYLDDNSSKRNTPKLLGLTMALRTAGPAAGFVLGFLCLNVYIDPSLVPVIKRNDPRWLGAWWLGWIILGTVMTIFSFLMASFPKKLKKVTEKVDDPLQSKCLYDSVPNENVQLTTTELEMTLMKNKEAKVNEDVGMLKDFKNAVTRVCRNSLLMCNNFTAVFYILGASGYINFYTKYSETQFHQSAASSSMIAGVTTVISMIVGFLTSGFVISKFKPKESKLLLFNIFIALVYMAGELVFMFLGCDEDKLQGNFEHDGSFNPDMLCNSNCSCDFTNYSPVCFEKEGQTFFSVCHAGCSHSQDIVRRTYSNCSCLPLATDWVRQGPCDVNCAVNFGIFMAVQCLIQLIGCSGRITNILINYRCVEPRDKPLAQGLALFMISLVAFIPGPIIFGKVIDSSCLVWDSTCGNKGNCWVYDKKKFRIRLNSTALCFTFGAFVFDILVYYLGRNIKLYEETTTTKNKI